MTFGSRPPFERAFKLAALARVEAGEDVASLARELGVFRSDLYLWRKRFRAGGAEALRGRGRPRKASRLKDETAAAVVPRASEAALSEALAGAGQRIEALERKIGQQQVELDFFQQALRQVGALRPSSAAPGGTHSMRSSRQ